MTILVRNLQERDRDEVMAWITALGWNPGTRDAECLAATDPDGLFVAEEDGQIVGFATGIAYDDTFGFVGALVVNPELGGRAGQVVLRIYRHVREYLGSRLVGIDALSSTRDFFIRGGQIPAYRHVRYRGILPPGGSFGGEIVPLRSIPLEEIIALDAQLFPVPRPRFWTCWLDAYGANGAACRDSRNRLAGFGILRPARRGWRAGPLIAADAAMARTLLLTLAPRAEGQPVTIDVPEINQEALLLAESFSLHRLFTTTRLYTRSPGSLRVVPPPSMNRLFGIVSYEFG